MTGGAFPQGRRILSVSPDGSRLAMTGFGDGPLSKISVMDLPSGKVAELSTTPALLFDRTKWTPSGRGLIAEYIDASAAGRRTQIGYVSYPAGTFQAITKDTNSYSSIGISSDGHLMATVQGKQLFTLSVIPMNDKLAGTPAVAIPQQQRDIMRFTWAGNDGFYVTLDDRLVHTSADGSNVTPILNNQSSNHMAACPDGKSVLLSTRAKNQTALNIWRMNPDGTNLQRLSDGRTDQIPACSIDSKWAYYYDSDANRIKRVPLAGGTPEALAPPGALIVGSFYLDRSPDGGEIAVLVADSAQTTLAHRIALIPTDPKSPTPVRYVVPNAGIADNPRFTPDGKALIYPVTMAGADNVWWQPMDGSAARQITNFKSDSIFGMEFSPDGKKLAVMQRRLEADVVLLRETK